MPGLASAAVVRVGPAMTRSVPHALRATLSQDARQRLPETPGNLCWHPPPGDQRFSDQYFPARPLHDPVRLAAPGAVAQQARLAKPLGAPSRPDGNAVTRLFFTTPPASVRSYGGYV